MKKTTIDLIDLPAPAEVRGGYIWGPHGSVARLGIIIQNLPSPIQRLSRTTSVGPAGDPRASRKR